MFSSKEYKSKPICDTSNTVFDQFDVEIDKKTKLKTR
jgi:hypothetical protein